MGKRTPVGFIVYEYSLDFEQTLSLDESEGMPDGGVLDWRSERAKAFVFTTRKDAKEAIDRTEHYRLAFGTNHPEKRNCKIVPVESKA